MPNPIVQEPSRQRDGWVGIGMVVSATSAALTSFDGLRRLALAAGWANAMAWLLPLTVDAFAATATRIWLIRATSSEKAKRVARACAIGAILLSLAGNAAFHLIHAGLLQVTWIIVLGVGAIPPIVLGLVSHLAVLRSQQDHITEDERSTVLSPVPPALPEQPKPAVAQEKVTVPIRTRPPAKKKAAPPRYTDDDVLLAAARAADAAYREAHGRVITRDALRQQLRIGGERATAMLRRIKEECTESA